ncbi:hypothetical protein BDV39DRAFT_39529 [Aspergillus sergii]|uniref:Uncharacterized protein n=1 Tax=Aspergillus sergii TaxID=1034303 RepID=A0A5N6XAM2_9EURO|nr:hypothetical protein BDV39DRAFT_39529 [Aspergillus sergii]
MAEKRYGLVVSEHSRTFDWQRDLCGQRHTSQCCSIGTGLSSPECRRLAARYMKPPSALLPSLHLLNAGLFVLGLRCIFLSLSLLALRTILNLTPTHLRQEFTRSRIFYVIRDPTPLPSRWEDLSTLPDIELVSSPSSLFYILIGPLKLGFC